MKNIIFIIFCLAQTGLHCMDDSLDNLDGLYGLGRLGRLTPEDDFFAYWDDSDKIPTPTLNELPLFAQTQIGQDSEPEIPGVKPQEELDELAARPDKDNTLPVVDPRAFNLGEVGEVPAPRVGRLIFFCKKKTDQDSEPVTPGVKRKRTIAPQEKAARKKSKKFIPQELAKIAGIYAENHYKNLEDVPSKSNKHKTIKANEIPGLSSEQVQELQQHYASFLQKQIEAKRLLSDESCWQNGNFVCKHKIMNVVECEFSTNRRSLALRHLESYQHLDFGAYFCIPCLSEGNMHTNTLPQNMRAHIISRHGQEHVESGVGQLSPMDGYKAKEKPAELETPGVKRKRIIIPQAEQKKYDINGLEERTTQEPLKLTPSKSNKHKTIKANEIPGLSSEQVQELQQHHASFLQKQIEVQPLLSDESCWQNGIFVCKHKKMNGKKCEFATNLKRKALMHIKSCHCLDFGPYFCIPCLLEGNMYINTQPTNIRTHISVNHDPEHVESGVGMLSAMDGYNASAPEDNPVEPEGQQQQEPADKQPDMQVSPYRISDAPQSNAPLQPDTQRVQTETHKLTIDAGIQTDQVHEIATQTDDPPEIEADQDAIYLPSETCNTETDLTNVKGKSLSIDKALEMARGDYLRRLLARYCCQTCLEQKKFLFIRDTEFSIKEHSDTCHPGEKAKIIDLAKHEIKKV